MTKKNKNKTTDLQEKKNVSLQKDSRKCPKKVKKLIFFLISCFVFIATIQYVLFYFALPLLKDNICQRINKKTENLYAIDFDSLNVNFLARSLTLHNFSLRPDTAVYLNFLEKFDYNKAIYNIDVDKLTIKNISLSSLFSSKSLKINELNLEKTSVRLVKKPKDNNNGKYDAVHRDLYPMLKIFFDELFINKLSISDGYFDFYLKITDEKQKAVVGKINLILEKLHLNQTSYEANNKLFYSEKILLQSHGYNIALGDSIHTITAGELTLNSFDSIIYAKDVKLIPTNSNLNIQYGKNDIFNIKLDEISISGIDLNTAYFQKSVGIKNVSILNPQIKFSKGKTKKKETVSHSRGNWYQLIKGTLENISIDSLSVKNAQLNISNPAKFSKPAYEIEKIDIALRNFYIDSLSSVDKNKIFYSDDIDIDLKNLKMRLPDKRHLLTTRSLRLSSNSQNVEAKGIKIKPMVETNDSTIKQINLSVPYINLVKIDIKKAYNYKICKIGSLVTTLPDIKIKSFIDTVQSYSSKQKFLATIFDEYFNNLSINRIFIKNGVLNIASKASITQDSLALEGKINLKLSNFVLNNNTLSEKIPFIAKNVNLELDNFIIKPSKEIHIFKCEKILINTNDSCIKINNLSYAASEDSFQISSLKRLGKSRIMDVKIEKADVSKIDINKFLVSKNLETSLINIKNPEFNINFYPQLKNIYNHSELSDSMIESYEKTHLDVYRDSIFNLLSFTDKSISKIISKDISIIKIDSIVADSGIVNFNIKDTLDNKKVSTKNTFFISISKFDFNRDSLPDENKFLFANDYYINLDKFQFLLPDRVHKIKASNINLSTQQQFLYANQLWVGKSSESKLHSNNIVNFYLPEGCIKGIDFIHFAKTGNLLIDSCNVNSFVMLLIKQNTDSLVNMKNKKQFENNFKSLTIKNISASDSKFAIMKGENRFFNSDFDFKCACFSIDSNNIEKNGSLFSITNPNVKINQLYFQTPKGNNTLKTNYIRISDNDVEIRHLFFENKNQENSLSENTKNYVYFPRVNVRDVDVEKMAFSKKIVARSMEINNPEIELTPTKKNAKSSNSNSKDSLQNTFTAIIDTIKSSGIKLTVNRKEKTPIKLENLDFFAQYLNTEMAHPTFIPAEKMSIGINNYSTFIQDSLYRMSAGRIEFLPINQTLKISNVDFRPTTNRYEFYKHFKNRKSAPYIFCKTVEAEKFNVASLAENNKLEISKLKLDNISFLSYINRTKTYDTSAIKPNLHQYIRKIPFKTKIDTTLISHGYIAIEQLNPEASTPGLMTITDIYGRIINLTNDSVDFKRDSVLKFDGHGKIMDRAEVSASFRYTINSPNDEFYCNAHLDSLFLPDLNPFLENALFARIDDGILTEADIKFTSDNNYSKGESIFKYHDLKLAVNKRDSVQAKKRGLLSLLANSLIRTDNPKHKFSRVKVGYIYAEPETYKGFSSYWVKSMLSGAKATAGFESKEQKNERRFADKVRDIMSKKQRQKNKDKQIKQKIYENEINENRLKQKNEHKIDN